MKFELTYKPLRKIFYWFTGFIILILFFGDYLYELKYGRSSGNSNSLEITGIIFTFVLLFPSLLITLFYLKENFKTESQGLSHIFSDGSLMVEEQNHGRIILFNNQGKKEWEFVNKDNKGYVTYVSWSRIIEDEQFIRNFKSLVKNKKCLN